MKIQSLSIVVPNKKCVNNCKFCVSRMRKDIYPNLMDKSYPGYYTTSKKEYIKRLAFARDNGCNTVMLTGETEPQQNRSFLSLFSIMNNELNSPFRWIEMQTTGVILDEDYLNFLKEKVEISTISLSVSSPNIYENAEMHQTPNSVIVDYYLLAKRIKNLGFNLRMSVNMTNTWEKCFTPSELLDLFHFADQVTFRKLYVSNNDTPQNEWIKANRADESYIDDIYDYILNNGKPLEVLEFGQTRYSVKGLSVVIDDDCMARESKSSLKYLVLRPNCKLYTKWDDKASLLF